MKSITHYWQSINFVSLILAPLSFFFCFLVSIRRFFYRIGVFKSTSSQLPVIVVGNIYIGGNGKTPFVVWLVEQLKDAGYKPGVVSRGYGAQESGAQESGAKDLAWPRRVDLHQDVQLFGDEPFLIHQSTQCPVYIDPIRPRAIEQISLDTDCDVIISDDGLQHYAMSRYIEINITDAKRLYGNGLCLPAGPLREKESRLRSVDYIIYNISRYNLKKMMQQYENKSFTMDFEASIVKPVFSGGGQSMTLSDFKGKIVHAVAGIGDPEQFFRFLESHGLNVITHPFADHYQYKQKDLLFNEPYPIIMTEKDAVKYQSFSSDSSISELWYLPIKARVDNKLINKIITQLKSFKTNYK